MEVTVIERLSMGKVCKLAHPKTAKGLPNYVKIVVNLCKSRYIYSTYYPFLKLYFPNWNLNPTRSKAIRDWIHIYHAAFLKLYFFKQILQ